jgi:hypothetical protein
MYCTLDLDILVSLELLVTYKLLSDIRRSFGYCTIPTIPIEQLIRHYTLRTKKSIVVFRAGHKIFISLLVSVIRYSLLITIARYCYSCFGKYD